MQVIKAHQQERVSDYTELDNSSFSWKDRLAIFMLKKTHGVMLWEEILSAARAKEKTDAIVSMVRDQLVKAVDPIVLMQYAQNGHSIYVTTGEYIGSFAEHVLADFSDFKGNEVTVGVHTKNHIAVARIQNRVPQHTGEYGASSVIAHEFGHYHHTAEANSDMMVATQKDLAFVKEALHFIGLECLYLHSLNFQIHSHILALMGLPQKRMSNKDKIEALFDIRDIFTAKIARFMDLDDVDVAFAPYYAEYRKEALEGYPTSDEQLLEIPAVLEELCYRFPRPLVRHFLPHTFEVCARSYDALYAQYEKPEEALRKGGFALIRWDEHHCKRTDRSEPHCHGAWVDGPWVETERMRRKIQPQQNIAER